MRILIVGEDWHGSMATSCEEALVTLGHEATIFDFRREVESRAKFASMPIVRKLERNRLKELVNGKLVDTAVQLKLDVLFVFKGELITPETLERIRKATNAILCNWNPDNPFNKVNSTKDLIRSIPVYDVHLTWGKFLIPELRRVGAKRVEYLPFGYDARLHYPVNVSDEEGRFYGSDVVFIGTWEKEREEMLRYITDFDLGIWGNSWERTTIPTVRRCVRSKARYGEEMSKICNASKIVLNFIRKQNGNAHNMRTFEVPACGGFMLTTRTQEQVEFFGENGGVACFDGVDDLREKIQYYLTHEEERKRIAQCGAEKVLNGKHSYLDRMRRVIDCIRVLKKDSSPPETPAKDEPPAY